MSRRSRSPPAPTFDVRICAMRLRIAVARAATSAREASIDSGPISSPVVLEAPVGRRARYEHGLHRLPRRPGSAGRSGFLPPKIARRPAPDLHKDPRARRSARRAPPLVRGRTPAMPYERVDSLLIHRGASAVSITGRGASGSADARRGRPSGTINRDARARPGEGAARA